MEGEVSLEVDMDQWTELRNSNIAVLTVFDNDMQNLLSKLTQSGDDDDTVDTMAG